MTPFLYDHLDKKLRNYCFELELKNGIDSIYGSSF